MNDNKIELSGVFSEGYGIIPKKLMKMKLDKMIGKQKGKNVKLVLAYMLSFTGSGNTCFPSIKKISEDLEISEPTIIEAIKNACSLNLIDKEKMYPNDPLKHNNKYLLKFLNLNGLNIDIKTDLVSGENGFSSRVISFKQNNNNINNNSINNNIECNEKNKKYIMLAELLYNEHKKHDENYLVNKNLKSIFKSWSDSIRLLIEKDKRDYELVKEIIIWCQSNDNFWIPNILSGKKLREKFSTLYSQYIRDIKNNKSKKKKNYENEWLKKYGDKLDKVDL